MGGGSGGKLRLRGRLVVVVAATEVEGQGVVMAEMPLVPVQEQWCLQERNSNRASSVKIIFI